MAFFPFQYESFTSNDKNFKTCFPINSQSGKGTIVFLGA